LRGSSISLSSTLSRAVLPVGHDAPFEHGSEAFPCLRQQLPGPPIEEDAVAPDLDHVPEASRSDHRRARKAARDQGVRRHRRAVGEQADLPPRATSISPMPSKTASIGFLVEDTFATRVAPS
jgi:hypothetical protein